MMFKVSGKRPSAGVIIGMLALVMAIAGPAIAGPATKNTLTKRQVTAIAANEIHKLAPSLSVKRARTADAANTANTANTASTANTAKIATNVLSANVLANGTMLGSISSGATSTLVAPDGIYNVTLGRDITGCTISASSADNTNDPAVGMVAVGVLNSTTLRVITLNQSGIGTQRSFYVHAICPRG
jgi:hypothetical protein